MDNVEGSLEATLPSSPLCNNDMISLQNNTVVRECQYCYTEQPTDHDYKDHLLKIHAEEFFHCAECDTYVDRKDLVLHMSLHALQYATKNKVMSPSLNMNPKKLNMKRFKKKDKTGNKNINEAVNVDLNVNINPEINDNISADLTSDINLDINGYISANLSPEINDNISADLSSNINPKINDNVSANLSSDINPEINDNISANLSSDINPAINDNISANLSPDINSEINDNISANLSSDINPEINDNIRANLIPEINDSINSDLIADPNKNIRVNINSGTNENDNRNINAYDGDNIIVTENQNNSDEANQHQEKKESSGAFQNVQSKVDIDFSDHSDTDNGFEPLPESIFEAIEDSQESQVPTHEDTREFNEVKSVIGNEEFIDTIPLHQGICSSQTISYIPSSLTQSSSPNTCPIVFQSMAPYQSSTMTQKTLPILNIPNIQNEIYKQKIQVDESSNLIQSNLLTQSTPSMLNTKVAQTAPHTENTPTIDGKKKKLFNKTCPICDKAYKVASSYFYHMRYIHNGSRDYGCLVCGKKFMSKATLTQHSATHTEECDFECDHCGKKFRTKVSLYIHIQNHATVKKYPCQQCPKEFRWRQQLWRHLQRHAAEKAHVCTICARGFNIRGDLLRHMRTHDAGSYNCQICGVAFAQIRYLKAHYHKKHGMVCKKGLT